MRSANFLAVSVLSSCHPPLLLPGCGGSAPCAISGHDVSLQPENQAARANCWLAILFLPRLTILSKSGRTLGHRNSCRNLSAPITSMQPSLYRQGWVIILRSCLYVDDPFRDQYRVGHLSWPVPDAYRLWCGLGQAQVQLWRDHL